MTNHYLDVTQSMKWLMLLNLENRLLLKVDYFAIVLSERSFKRQMPLSKTL